MSAITSIGHSVTQSITQSIILGVTEGATEFLPVSSSGHLLIVRKLLGLPLMGSLAFDAVLQLAAAVALVIYFWRDIVYMLFTFVAMVRGGFRSRFHSPLVNPKERTLVWAIIFGTIPAVVFGLLLQKYLDTTFRNIKLVAIALLAGSALMYTSQRYAQRYEQKNEQKQQQKTVGKSETRLSIKKGVIIGFFQALALIPGVSRSGSTISGGLFNGLSREEAVRFSFLLSVPVLLGSGLKELWSVRHVLGATFGVSLLIGSVASFVVALAAIHYFIRFLKNHNLNLFIWYRVLVAVLILYIF